VRTKTLNIFSYISIVITFVFLIGVSIALFWPYQTLDITSFKVIAENPRAAAVGQLISIEADCTKYTTLPCRYSFGLLDGYYQVTESGVSNLPAGHIKIKKKIKVSEEVPAGVYKVQFTVAYDVNPIRTITKVFVTDNTFTIEP
jgi:hypothetical protein